MEGEAEDEADTLRSLREAVRTSPFSTMQLPLTDLSSCHLPQDEQEKRAQLDKLGPQQLRLLLRKAKRQRIDKSDETGGFVIGQLGQAPLGDFTGQGGRIRRPDKRLPGSASRQVGRRRAAARCAKRLAAAAQAVARRGTR